MSKVRAGVLLTVLLLISLPYMQAARAATPDAVFGGFFLNPMDGNTYLAKMRQGWEGAWQFRLPYTSDPGEGSYLFIFYLFLGHAAKALGIPLLLTFHLARIGAALLLLLALDRFFRAIFPEEKTAMLAFCLAALGTGMGWLAALARWVSADMWVAEAYPFLASLSNPHFPLSLAIMSWLLTPTADQQSQTDAPMPSARHSSFHIIGSKAIAGGLILSLLSPFGAIITGLVFAGKGLWLWLVERRIAEPGAQSTMIPSSVLGVGASLAGLALGSAPVMLYDFWIARLQPALAGWNAQNIIPTPPVWDVTLSLSPALLFAVTAVWACRGDARRNPSYRLLVLWAGAGLLIFLPANLQLRFMIGLFIPISGLAAIGIEKLAQASPRRRRNLVAMLFGLSLPTLLFIQLAEAYTIQSRSNTAYLTWGEAQAMQWIDSHTQPTALILAAPDTGLLIPAHTGRRVIYGHPFETVNAKVEKASVEAFFRSGSDSEARLEEFLAQRKVDFLFYGPREQALGRPAILDRLRMVYQAGGVEIYAVK